MDDEQKAAIKKIVEQLEALRGQVEDLEDNEDGIIAEALAHLENCVDELTSLLPQQED